MSLSLLQGYSSAEEEDEIQYSDEDENENENEATNLSVHNNNKSFLDIPKPSSGSRSSGLPSALDVFSQVTINTSLFLFIVYCLLFNKSSEIDFRTAVVSE
jgi:hypothetical protein